MTNPYEIKRYYCMALDPIHVGTGGYRLGRVDNTIVREPGTDLPKIPGTSISGVARAYTALAIQSNDPNKQKYLKQEIDAQGRPLYKSCAGKGGEGGEAHCGRKDCEVCVSYGFSKGKKSFHGMAQFSDARIMFFPVHSMVGPIWITSPSILKEFGVRTEVSEERIKFIKNNFARDRLNLGWLMLKKDEADSGLFSVPWDNFPDFSSVQSEIQEIIENRLLLIPDTLFAQIVNDNLEVRTSVAIDPATGAAEEGALYTYEAIPRATVLWFTVTHNDPGNFRINGKEIGLNIDQIIENMEKGLRYLKILGIGGMNTRGMGRLKVLNLED